MSLCSFCRESTIEEGEGIKPAFMTVAKSQVVSAGREKVTFEFRLIAAPRPQIQWFKDDQPLEETPRRRMSMYADVHLYILTLELTDIEPDDEGKYRIIATNKEGKAMASVSLEVTREFKKQDEVHFTLFKTQWFLFLHWSWGPCHHHTLMATYS